MTYSFDKWGECILGTDGDAAQIASDCFTRGHVVTTWTDGDGSKYDLLWSFDATRIGHSSMVDSGPGKLFVGVVGLGCFGFACVEAGYLAPDYVGSKLKVSGTETQRRLATLIDGVRGDLWAMVVRTNADWLAEPAATRHDCVNRSPEHLEKYTAAECRAALQAGE